MLVFFFFNDTATTEIYTLSLHDALPIYEVPGGVRRLGLHHHDRDVLGAVGAGHDAAGQDRKSTRLNSSHPSISYAVFCLKKKKTHTHHRPMPNAPQQTGNPHLSARRC